jgi:hypothetical protein
VILLAAATGNADCTDDFAVFFKGYAARENHHLAVIRCVDAEKLVARLTVVAKSLVVMSNALEVQAFLMEISTLPIQALSIRTWATRFPPASATAMFIG